MTNAADLPDDIDTLKARLLASEGRNLRKQDRIDRLEKLVADFKRALFGVKSERVNPEQYELALEDIETAMAAIHAEDEAIDPPVSKPAPRKTNPYVRRLLIHGARACMIHLKAVRDQFGAWIEKLKLRMHPNKVVVALANKIARIAWVILTKPGALYERVDPAYS